MTELELLKPWGLNLNELDLDKDLDSIELAALIVEFEVSNFSEFILPELVFTRVFFKPSAIMQLVEESEEAKNELNVLELDFIDLSSLHGYPKLVKELEEIERCEPRQLETFSSKSA